MRLKDELTRGSPSPATLERVWAGVRAKTSPLPRRRRWWPVVTLAVTGVVLLLAWVHRPRAALPQGELAEVQVAEGVKGRFSAGSRWDVTAGVVALHAGKAQLEVTRGPWVVTSRYLRMDVAAAELSVACDEVSDSVVVRRGEVTVRRASGDVVLHAGQTFSMGDEAPDWRGLAKAGELRAAWRQLGHEGVVLAARTSGPAEVLLLSEVAAAGEDDALACVLLEEVIDAPAAGSDRGVAAYMLGRRLQQRDPEKALAAWQRAERLGVPEELRGELSRVLAQGQARVH